MVEDWAYIWAVPRVSKMAANWVDLLDNQKVETKVAH